MVKIKVLVFCNHVTLLMPSNHTSMGERNRVAGTYFSQYKIVVFTPGGDQGHECGSTSFLKNALSHLLIRHDVPDIDAESRTPENPER